jgi:hypothetical protein
MGSAGSTQGTSDIGGMESTREDTEGMGRVKGAGDVGSIRWHRKCK